MLPPVDLLASATAVLATELTLGPAAGDSAAAEAAALAAAEPDWQSVCWWLGGGLVSLWICLRLAPVADALWQAAALLWRRPMTWILPVMIALAGGVTVWSQPLWQEALLGNLGLAVSRTLAVMHQPLIGAPAFVIGALLLWMNAFNARIEASYEARSRLRWRAVQAYLLLLAPAYIGAAGALWFEQFSPGWLPPVWQLPLEIVLALGHAHGAVLVLAALVVLAQDWRDGVPTGLSHISLWLRAVRQWPRLFPLAWIYAQLNLAAHRLPDEGLAATWLHGVLSPVFLALLLALPVILAGCPVRFGHGGALALEWWLRRPLSCAWFIAGGSLVLLCLQIGVGFLHAYVGGDTLWPWVMIQTATGVIAGTWLLVAWAILIYDDDWLDDLAAPIGGRPL